MSASVIKCGTNFITQEARGYHTYYRYRHLVDSVPTWEPWVRVDSYKVDYNESGAFNKIKNIIGSGYSVICVESNQGGATISNLTAIGYSGGDISEFTFTRSTIDSSNDGYITRYICNSSGWTKIVGKPTKRAIATLSDWDSMTDTGIYEIATQSGTGGVADHGTGESGQMGCVVTRSKDNGYITQMALGTDPAFRASSSTGSFSNKEWKYLVKSTVIKDIQVDTVLGSDPNTIYILV